MSKLLTAPRIEKPGEFYCALAALHEGLDAEASLVVNAKLILFLANHIGDHDVLMDAIERVKAGYHRR